MNLFQRAKKELELRLSRIISITPTKGPNRGRRIYGDFYIDRREGKLTDDELFYAELDLRGKTIVEAGAHIGLFTLGFGAEAGQGEGGRVYAFEPNPLNFYLLRKNVEANGLHCVEPLNVGLSNVETRQRFLSKRFNRATGTFRTDLLGDDGETAGPLIDVAVSLTTLDAFRAERRVECIDFVKIDTEGYEPFVIEGMRRTLAKDEPLLYFELHGITPTDRLADLERIRNVLQPLDYRLVRLVPSLPELAGELSEETAHGAFVAFRSNPCNVREALSRWQRKKTGDTVAVGTNVQADA